MFRGLASGNPRKSVSLDNNGGARMMSYCTGEGNKRERTGRGRKNLHAQHGSEIIFLRAPRSLRQTNNCKIRYYILKISLDAQGNARVDGEPSSSPKIVSGAETRPRRTAPRARAPDTAEVNANPPRGVGAFVNS